MKQKLGEICEIFSGGTPSTKIQSYWNGDLSWLSSGETRNNLITKTERKITQLGVEKSSTRLAKKNDIVIATAGQGHTRGQISFCLIDTYVNQSIVVLRTNKSIIRPKFLFYNLKSRYKELRGLSDAHSSRGSLPKNILSNLDIIFPSLIKQKQIEKILYNLDAKIELNHKINQTLEKISRALFKSWFIDFDPVRAKIDGRWQAGKSLPSLPANFYNLFPDRLNDSEFGNIPEGWRIIKLGDIALQRRFGVDPIDVSPNTPYIALEHMPKHSIALSDWKYAKGLASNKYKFERGDVLFGKLRPYFAKVGVAPLDGICSTDIVVVSPTFKDGFGLILCNISSSKFIDYTNARSFGTKMPRTSWTDMSKYKIIFPTPKLSRIFSNLIQTYTDEIITTIHNSRTLTIRPYA